MVRMLGLVTVFLPKNSAPTGTYFNIIKGIGTEIELYKISTQSTGNTVYTIHKLQMENAHILKAGLTNVFRESLCQPSAGSVTCAIVAGKPPRQHLTSIQL